MNITGPMTLSGALLLLGQVNAKQMDARPWIALAGLWWLLVIVTGRLGSIGPALAWLVALGMIYLYGTPVLKLVTKSTRREPQT